MSDTVRGRCVLSGALTTGRLGNGDFMCPEYIEGMRRNGRLDASSEYTDLFFSDNPHLEKVVRDGHVYAINKSLPPPNSRLQ